MFTTATKRKEHKGKDVKKADEASVTAAEDTLGSKSRTILPKNKVADAAAAHIPQGATKSVIATQSFHDAVEHCKLKVAKIAKECRSANRKYRDFHFDLRNDGRHCLDGLTKDQGSELDPAGMARVEVCLFFLSLPFIDEWGLGADELWDAIGNL